MFSLIASLADRPTLLRTAVDVARDAEVADALTNYQRTRTVDDHDIVVAVLSALLRVTQHIPVRETVEKMDLTLWRDELLHAQYMAAVPSVYQTLSNNQRWWMERCERIARVIALLEREYASRTVSANASTT